MNMRSPTVAMLWEIWRVTRVEAAWRLVIGIVGALSAQILIAAFTPPDEPQKYEGFSGWISMTILVIPHFMGWVSLAKYNGGRLGFPFRHVFMRPVRTTIFVGVPMAYLIAVTATIYLLSALLLKAISGYPFPLLPVAAWIAALTVAMTAITWSTRTLTAHSLPGMAFAVSWMVSAIHRLDSAARNGYDWMDSPKLWPTIFDVPLTDYALVALIALASFGASVAFVSRQRHGDDSAAFSGASGTGWPERFVNLIRLPCPISSATRAQVWFELKSKGLPLLTIAVVLAVLNPLLFAVSGSIDAAIWDGWRSYVSCAKTGCFHARGISALFATASLPIVLALGSFNAFGVRGRQGLTYLEAVQPYGTPQLAGLKLLVRSACVLVALVAVGVSIWTFLPVLGDAIFIQMWNVPLVSWQLAINDAVAALAGYEQLALVIVVAIVVVVWIATFAVLAALWMRYSRGMNTVASLLLVYGLALSLLLLAERYGLVSPLLVDALFTATRWIATAAIVLATAYLFWSGFAERVLTTRYVCIAFGISAAFLTAWVTLEHAASAQSMTNASSILLLLLLLLMASALAPWSLNRIRHL
jgi:hypothetical protein